MIVIFIISSIIIVIISIIRISMSIIIIIKGFSLPWLYCHFRWKVLEGHTAQGSSRQESLTISTGRACRWQRAAKLLERAIKP
eukprot:2779160-Pyramimonas_sp.AAC.1